MILGKLANSQYSAASSRALADGTISRQVAGKSKKRIDRE
jgi:hypothetical protein